MLRNILFAFAIFVGIFADVNAGPLNQLADNAALRAVQQFKGDMRFRASAKTARTTPNPSVGVQDKQAPEAFVHFAEVTLEAGLPLEPAPTHGMAWGDFDNDGWVDLYILHHAKTPSLMHNNQDGTFADVTGSAGMETLTDRHGCEWGDLNNDLYLDLYCNAGAQRGLGAKPNQLWKNNGDGTFQDVAAAMGVINARGRGRSVNWFDYNGDGMLDLFVANQLRQKGVEPNRLYRNEGSFFTDLAASTGLSQPLPIVASALVDYNQDNLWDLTIAPGNNLTLFKRKKNGGFKALGPEKTGLLADNVVALAWGDYDNDGYQDLYVAAEDTKSKLFHNDHNGVFTEVTATANLQAVNDFDVASALWADWNNDGWLDLFVVRRGPKKHANAPDVLLRNNGNGAFTDVTALTGVAGPTTGKGDAAAAADYDNDGFLDLFVTNGRGSMGNGLLYRNLGNRNHWLTLQLVGAHSNSLALGSKVWLQTGDKTQYREYLDNGGSWGQSQFGAHFGLGKATTIQSIKIQWPDSQIQELNDVAVDQILVIRQP